jgi:hypothetical protein
MRRTAYLLVGVLVLVGSSVASAQVGNCLKEFDACDDGIFCNGDDVCTFKDFGGIPTLGCFLHTDDPCVSQDECKREALCNEQNDSCSYPDRGPCTPDQSECTADVCAKGECTHPPISAGFPCNDDDNDCTDDVCDGAGACTHPNNEAPCNDRLFCNGTDTCSGGSCDVHAGNPCADGPECANSCNEDVDSCSLPKGQPCSSDENACTDDQCDGVGVCAHVPNTDACDDGLFCNGADSCGGGSCSFHNGDPCVTGDACSSICDENDDTCLVPEGIPCSDDDNPCTDDVCLDGGCAHEFIPGCEVCLEDSDCDDANPCTVDSCAVEGCTNESISGCVACATDIECDDGNACTTDRCDRDNLCVYSDAECFAAVTCSFISGLAFDECEGERIPSSVLRQVDRAGCRAEQAGSRALKGTQKADRKLKSGNRSIEKASRKVRQARGKKISAACADALSAQLTGFGGTFAGLMDKANQGARLAACTESMTAPGATPQFRGAPSLCTKR